MGRPRLSTDSPHCRPVSYYCLNSFHSLSRHHPIHVNHGDTNAKSVAKLAAGCRLARLTRDRPAKRTSEACGWCGNNCFSVWHWTVLSRWGVISRISCQLFGGRGGEVLLCVPRSFSRMRGLCQPANRIEPLSVNACLPSRRTG